jgi:hypothetical protein
MEVSLTCVMLEQNFFFFSSYDDDGKDMIKGKEKKKSQTYKIVNLEVDRTQRK